MFLKGLIAAVFENSERLHLLRLNGHVSAIPIHRESTDSLIMSVWLNDCCISGEEMKDSNSFFEGIHYYLVSL